MSHFPLEGFSWHYLFSLFKNPMPTKRASWSVTEHATLQFFEAAIREKTPNLSIAKIAQKIAETGSLHEKNATQIWNKIRTGNIQKDLFEKRGVTHHEYNKQNCLKTHGVAPSELEK